jgi:hypothetical protein
VLSKKKKNYISILEIIGLINITGFSKNYIENVLIYVENLDTSKIKKRFRIKIKIIIRRIF